MALDKEAILKFVQNNGPLLPVELAKNLDVNILFASAILSEFVDSKKMKLSYIKIGGSPLYYCAGQEVKLQTYKDKLPDALKSTFDILKEKKLLEENSLEPLNRAALRELKDFAVRLEVNRNDTSIFYWKWYMSTHEEVQSLLNSMQTPIPVQQSAQEHIQEPVIELEQLQTPELEEPIVGTKPEEPQVVEPVQPEESLQEQFIQEEVSPVQEQQQEVKKQQPISEGFEQRVIELLAEKNVKINKRDVIRKGKEIDFIATIETALGEQKVFIKAKDKKKINDADLALIRSEYPLVLITSGELTKKADEFLQNGIYVMVVSHI